MIRCWRNMYRFNEVNFLSLLLHHIHTLIAFCVYTTERTRWIMKQVKSPKQKLVHQRTVSASGNDVIASTSPSTAKESDGGDQQQSNFSRIINGSVRRRGELHKKLESLHKRQSLRSGNLLDRFRQDLPAGDDLSHIRESSWNSLIIIVFVISNINNLCIFLAMALSLFLEHLLCVQMFAMQIFVFYYQYQSLYI